jgi:NAD(P)-dependent dehydrogenase (short-subunit alcohol dehydrogenase family)
MASYAVAKAALNMVVRKFANELLKDGFTVLSLHPGWVSTRMGGPQAPLTPKESVTNLLKTLEVNSKPASTGKFYQYDGEQVPW